MSSTTTANHDELKVNLKLLAGFSVLIVTLSVVLTLITIFVAKMINSGSLSISSGSPAQQSLVALNYVRGHVEDYWYEHGKMPQYVSLKQLGIEPDFVKDLPALRFVRVGGHAVDKQSTFIEAGIGYQVSDTTKGHSVIMTVDSMPEASLRGRQTYYRCYVRGPNGTAPSADMKLFPGLCRSDNPLGGMGVEGADSGRPRLEWPILK